MPSMGPAPNTTVRIPGSTSPRSTPLNDTDIGSTNAPCSIVTASGSDFANGFLVGGSLSMQFRASPHFAITPGVEFQRLLAVGTSAGSASGDAGFSFVSFGVAFQFGGMPHYGPPEPPPPAVQPTPVYGPPAGGAVQVQVGPAGPPAPPPGY